MIIGLLVIFAGGVSWLALSVAPSFGAALQTGFVPFVLPDLVKIAAAAAVLPQVWAFTGRAGRRPGARP
jgi:biotin transport system substrate-specific component